MFKPFFHLIFVVLVVTSCATDPKKEEMKKTAATAQTEESMETGVAMEEELAEPISPEVGEYTIQKGDTLMWISFKIYGDYRKWRSIYEQNQHVRFDRLVAGQTLFYELPEKEFVWNRVGEPHLIKRGESLSKISIQRYGTWTRWRDIYNNNRQMIRDPNLIFAGFTLYVPQLKVRQLGMK